MIEKSREELLKEMRAKKGNTNSNVSSINDTSYMNSLISQINEIDENTIKDASFEDNSNIEDRIINSEIIEKQITYIWVLAHVIYPITDLKKGEKMNIRLNGEELETVFSYHATAGFVSKLDEQTGEVLSTYSDEVDELSLYLGVNEAIINRPGSESVKAMFRQSRFYAPALYRTSDFKLIRENGEELQLSSIKF